MHLSADEGEGGVHFHAAEGTGLADDLAGHLAGAVGAHDLMAAAHGEHFAGPVQANDAALLLGDGARRRVAARAGPRLALLVPCRLLPSQAQAA